MGIKPVFPTMFLGWQDTGWLVAVSPNKAGVFAKACVSALVLMLRLSRTASTRFSTPEQLRIVRRNIYKPQADADNR